MCKAMMAQRNRIEAMLKDDLEKCLKKIRENGGYATPSVIVDLGKLFIANREYFERQGFFFDTENRIENDQVKYYAWLKLGGQGELAAQFWNKIHEARETFVKNQRQKIFDRLREAKGSYILVDMHWLLFENKLFFEEYGFYFEPEIRNEAGKIQYLARMKKRR